MAQQTTVFTHSDYAVGWICALSEEHIAATAMLDEKHQDLPKLPNDSNTYTLGSVLKHNVVIACLPKGNYGTSSATVVGTRMAQAFPSIRFVLMVGIGGGIPPKVRLGDVVVSTPTEQYPGVVQWGKTKEGNFEPTGALNNPPTLLLTAISRLEVHHEMEGTDIPKYLKKMEIKY